MGSLLRISAAIAALVVAGLAAVYAYVLHWAATPVAMSEPVVVELLPGGTFAAFAKELEAVGVLHSAWPFVAYARLNGAAHRVQAGEYRVVPGETPEAFLADLVAGAVVRYEIRIVEGSTAMGMFEQLANTPKLVNDIGTTSADTLLEQLQLPPGHAEGEFFPDTYDYRKGTRVSAVLLRAHERLRDVLEREWALRAPGLPYTTPEQALVMASIIEKETGRDDERAKVSRVFVSRLKRGMRLQTDPTVIYGLGESFDGNLTRAQMEVDSPYNTYRYAGLPPTPIALPGLASIQAALHPADGDFLYFVARGDGTSVFSTTLEEHLAAVKRYQLDGGAL